MNTPLFTALVDDAGLFPPAELSMSAAVARHRDTDGHPVLSGRFLCPATRLPELSAALESGERLVLGLITPLDEAASALAQVDADPRLALAIAEGPLGDLTALPPGVRVFVEVPVADHAAIAAVAAAGHAVKVRCGGLRAELFPSAEQLGAFVHACAKAGASFKATAGLHHALPYHDDRTGFTHHGFLNLLLAACRSVAGAACDDVVAVLRATDADALVADARAVTADQTAAARELFVSYGSCDTSQPIVDLHALGLIGEQA